MLYNDAVGASDVEIADNINNFSYLIVTLKDVGYSDYHSIMFPTTITRKAFCFGIDGRGGFLYLFFGNIIIDENRVWAERNNFLSIAGSASAPGFSYGAAGIRITRIDGIV